MTGISADIDLEPDVEEAEATETPELLVAEMEEVADNVLISESPPPPPPRRAPALSDARRDKEARRMSEE